MPTSCCEIATPPITQVSFGNGLGKARTSADQIRPARPLKIRTRPIVTITVVRIEARSIGRITVRCRPTPSPKAKTSVTAKASQMFTPWFSISVQAM